MQKNQNLECHGKLGLFLFHFRVERLMSTLNSYLSKINIIYKHDKIKIPVILFFSFLDEKLSHPWIQIQKKKTIKLSMSFDRKKIKI